MKKASNRATRKNASPARFGESVTSDTVIVDIPIESIIVDEVRSYVDQDAMSNLISSIAIQGQQIPLHVTPAMGKTVKLVSGYLRLKARKALGLSHAPCIVLCHNEAEPWKWAENVVRSQLDALTHAEHLVGWVRWIVQQKKDRQEGVSKSKRRKDEQVQTAARIAAFGSTDAARRKNFQRAKKIVDLPDEVKEAARANNLYKTASTLRKIAACGSRDAQLKKIKNIVEERSQKPIKRIDAVKTKRRSPPNLSRAVVDDEISGNYSALEQAWRGSAFARAWENSTRQDRITFCEEYLEIRPILKRTDSLDDDDEIEPTATSLSSRRFFAIKNHAGKMNLNRQRKIDQWRPRGTRKVVW